MDSVQPIKPLLLPLLSFPFLRSLFPRLCEDSRVTTMSKFDRLPTELLEMICDDCDFADLKSLRQSCKSFLDVTTPRIFSHFHMGFFLTHLEHLMDLSTTPHIAAHVKHFTFVGDILPAFESEDEYESLIDLRGSWSTFQASYFRRHNVPVTESSDAILNQALMEAACGGNDIRTRALAEYGKLPRHLLTPDDVTYHYGIYLSYREQQSAWGEAEDNIFIQAFSKLPNLIAVSNDRYGFVGSNLLPPWRTLRREILVGPDDWMVKHAQEAEEMEGQLRHFTENELEKPIHMRHATCLLNGLNYRSQHMPLDGTDIKELVLSNIGSQPFLEDKAHWDRRGRRDSPTSISTMSGFEHLTSLELVVNYQFWDLGPPSLIARTNQLLAEVQSMFQAAIKVENFKLTMLDEDEDWGAEEWDNEEHDIMARLTAPVWPCLKNLRITCSTTERQWKRLLSKNAGTLKGLGLVDCRVMPEGTWESLIRELPKMLNLDEVYLEGLRDCEREGGLEAYFEAGLDVGPDADTHDKAVRDWILGNRQGEVPSLEPVEFHDQEG